MVCTIPRWGTIIKPGLVLIGPVVWAVGELYTQTHTHTHTHEHYYFIYIDRMSHVFGDNISRTSDRIR